MKLSIKKETIIILLVLICSFLTLCSTSSIVDLINNDTEKFYDKYDFSNKNFESYKVNDVLVIPYTVQNSEKSYDDKWYSYKLLLEVYKQDDNNSSIIINNVTVEGQNKVRLEKINKTLNKKIEFSKFDKKPNLQIGRGVLLDVINTQDMNLKSNSRIKVVLNITMEKDSIITTRDITYIFETRTRRYLNQR